MEEDNTPLEPLREGDVTKAIKKLIPNKSSDEFGHAAEHLKYGVEVICPVLTKVFNEILASSKSPESFKSWILTPVLKRDKDPAHGQLQGHYSYDNDWKDFWKLPSGEVKFSKWVRFTVWIYKRTISSNSRAADVRSKIRSLTSSKDLRDRPFNLKGGGGGVMVFCFVQNFFFGQHES